MFNSNYSASKIANPCVPTCPKRVGGCKVWCDKYEKYEEKKKTEEIERSKKVKAHFGTSYRNMLS